MGVISWIIFGALAGWVASLIAGTNRRQGCVTDIIVGVLGAFLGGFAMELLTGDEFRTTFSLTSFAVAVVGALVLLAIASMVRGGGRKRRRRRR